MQKIDLQLQYQDDRTMVLSVKFGKKHEYVAYRYMSAETIPLEVQALVLPKLLSGLAKKISLDKEE